MPAAFLAYVVAAFLFLLAGIHTHTDVDLVVWGWFAVAIGLALAAWSPAWFRRP